MSSEYRTELLNRYIAHLKLMYPCVFTNKTKILRLYEMCPAVWGRVLMISTF